MPRPPLILVSPHLERKGDEFGDLSITLSESYQRALAAAHAVPCVLGITVSSTAIAEAVRRCDGVLLTGGSDIDPRVYGPPLSRKLTSRVTVTPDQGSRDYRELVLVEEVFRQRKPLLAICRGHQLLNVALGGTLVPDIATRFPRALAHNRQDRRNQIVHEVRLTPHSVLSKIARARNLGVNSTHHQAVARIAAPLQPTAFSDDGIVEGLELKPAAAGWLPFLVSVQFHPERLADRYRVHQAIFDMFTQVCAHNRNNI